MNPIIFQIGPFALRWYAVFIITGALFATWLSTRRAAEYGENGDSAWDILPWALIGGIIGARIWHILTPPASMVAAGITTQFYLTHPLDMLAIWNGGLGIPGAVIGGFLAVLIYTRRHDVSLLAWADIVAPGLALAQGMGRLGNYANQELYGAPTNLPWKLFIDQAHRLPGYESVAYYHPLFLYELIYDVLNMLILLWVSKRFRHWLKLGDVFLMYLIIYPLGRFLLEFLRLDPSPVAGLNINQTLMGVTAVCSLIALILRHSLNWGTKVSAILRYIPIPVAEGVDLIESSRVSSSDVHSPSPEGEVIDLEDEDEADDSHEEDSAG